VNQVAQPTPRWDLVAASLLAAAAFAGLAVGVAAGASGVAALGGALLVASVAVRRPTMPWSYVLLVLLLVILFVPIRRYRIPGDLPFQLEPYRVLVGLIVLGWVASLLVDTRIRIRSSRFEAPLALILVAIVASIGANPSRVAEVQSTVLKGFTFFLSFVAVFYVLVSVVRSREVIDLLVKTLVAGGAAVAVLAVLESRTGMTPFTHLHQLIPFLSQDPSFGGALGRGGATRAYGPAEHPIALGAVLVMLVPLAIYVVRTAGRRWWFATAALVVGVLATVSRTGVVMLFVVGLVFLWLRPRETRRLWPALLPLLVVTHFAVPGTLGSLKQAFLPEAGLVGEQRGDAGSCSSSGRVADLGPTLAEVAERPFLGHGFGTRIVTGPDSNACILDNQWLGTLLEVGIFGTIAWLLLFLTVLRRLGQSSKRDDSPLGWLLVAITAGVAAYAVGMFTFDALGFVQVTFLLFVLLGLGAAAALQRTPPGPAVSAL
jgi:O-antigen ligase